MIPYKKIHADFFKTWSHDMSYLLGYIVADGCVIADKTRRNNPFTLNITSIDKEHLLSMREILDSEHKVGRKENGRGGIAY